MGKMNPAAEQRLKFYLLGYQNPDATRREVQKVMEVYPSLDCNFDNYVFNDGSQKNLLSLEGTIPVKYKGSYYNIPISIWLTDTHPNNAPMCFVKPTADMNIKVSIFVDHNGKIYLPYLHEWVPHSSDLLKLIKVMIKTFGEQPPVYAKQKAPAPYPVRPMHPVSGNRPNVAGNFPPYSPNSQYSGGGSSGSGGVYPPYPTEPCVGAFPYPNYPQFPGTGSNFQGYGTPHSTPYPPATQPSPTLPGSSGGNSGTITEEHIRASLLSAIEDKMRRRLREQFAQLHAELETLRRTQQELTSGSAHLSELLTKLKRERSELEKNINIMQDKQAELEKEISKLSDNQSIDVDEAVSTIAPLYKQMLNAFAEEAAIEDAIYYLGEGLRRGIIDLEAFLKQVRQLSRRQFMLKALMLRCRQKAGLTA